jgi:argininosuccinate lyase
VAHAVRIAADSGRSLEQLTLQELQALSPVLGPDAYASLTLEGSVQSRKHVGGTAPEQVRLAIAQARARLG